eukprot:9148910-Pyramimonas_sp.AAC.1
MAAKTTTSSNKCEVGIPRNVHERAYIAKEPFRIACCQAASHVGVHVFDMSSTMYAAHLDLKPIQGNFVTMIKAAMALPIKKERGARMDAVCGFTEDEEEEDAESQPALQLATQPERTVAQTDTSPDISSISDGVRNLRISQQAEAGGKDSDNGLKTGGKQSARDATQAEVETRLKRLPIQAS